MKTLIAHASIMPTIAVLIYLIFIKNPPTPQIDSGGWRIFTSAVAICILYYMLSNVYNILISSVEEKSIFVMAYTLIATSCIGIPVVFAGLYLSFEATGTCIDGSEHKFDELYFSYTTLTTLGYGDLKPIGFCRVFTAIESIIGYLSLGIVIAFGVAFFGEETLAKREEREKLLKESTFEEFMDLLDKEKIKKLSDTEKNDPH